MKLGLSTMRGCVNKGPSSKTRQLCRLYTDITFHSMCQLTMTVRLCLWVIACNVGTTSYVSLQTSYPSSFFFNLPSF